MGWTALPLILALAAPAAAQTATVPASPAPVAAPAAAATPATPQPPVEFSADVVTYDNQNDVLTAQGRVRLARDGNYVAADKVTWTRATGQVVATGNVVAVNPQGDKFVGDSAVLTDDIKNATVQNLLVVLESGARLAAKSATRNGDITTLNNAVYTPCPVTDGCNPRRPSWKVTAARVRYDSVRNRVRFERGRFSIFGLTVPLLPVFALSTGRGEDGVTGVLFPDFKVSGRNGFEIGVPFHLAIAPNRDLTLTPRVYTEALPSLEANYREVNKLGAFQIKGFITAGDNKATDPESDRSVRGYIDATGKFQFDPLWSLTAQIRRATDKTVTRRFDITREDKLRSFVNLERIDLDSYVSIAAWSFQGLLSTDRQAAIPIALPAIDARFRLTPPAIGGRIELEANSLAIIRRDGQDTQRAFASVRWDRRFLTPLGQELLLTGLVRGDIYHTDDSAATSSVIYRGEDGWNGRVIAAAAAEMRWPLIGSLLGGVQRLVPRIQVVANAPTRNLVIPNEDSRAIDLEASNLFSLNRFPGYDRWEDGSRVTYGLDWNYDRPNLAISTTIGQSYRFNRDLTIFPQGTGLSDRWSDIVGRTRVQFGRFVDLTHRFRLDKDNFAIRRNEVDLTVGTDLTYARVGYLRLNRNVDPTVEDLRDSQELRLAGRWQFAKYWSVFGATVVDLTTKAEDPLSVSDGFEPVRNRLSIDYEDACVAIGISWRRDYDRVNFLREGNTFQLRLVLKGLGR
ncbi:MULTISPECIES: LPS-assembly protein LptD [Sphingomonas]|uniref:LPS-assembly protein LptD n=1 Tax=Sphingomonas TaxID=13687 RepID=UPI000DF0004C|nr:MULTISPECIES: LPS assembly protein LptD [Sphingomonas]